MKRKFTILTAVVLLMNCLGLAQTTINWTAADQGYSNQQEITSVTFDDNVSAIFAQGTNSNAPKYYTTGSAIRCYGGNYFTITSTDDNLTNVVLTFASGEGSNAITTNVGTYSDGTWTGDAESVTFTIGGTSGHRRIAAFAITYGGDAPQPTYCTVTYDCNGGTSGCPENVTNITAGTQIELADAPSKDGFDFAGWSDGNTIYDENQDYTVNGNVTFTAQWTEQVSGDVHWILTDLADLTSTDVFVIVGNNGSNYAMKNTDASNSGPAAIAVTVSGTELSGTVPDNIKWNISGNATDGYIFYPNGSTTTWLYCTNNNNGLRIGSGNTEYNTFEIKASYIYNTARGRYVGIYNSTDWRSYTTSGGNIANQTFAFYKKVTGGVLPPSITANNVEIAYDATSGDINYTINNPVEGGTITATLEVGSWIQNVEVYAANNMLMFYCDQNQNGTARTATVTLSYMNGNEVLATKEVTVTQAAAPVVYSSIPALFEAATGTETNVLVNFNNWVVSGVSTNGKNVFVTDNEGHGFVIFSNSDMSNTYAAGNVLSGTAVSCTLKLYNGFAELLNVNASDLTITTGGTVTIANIAMAELAGVNTGALVHYDNLTCSVSGNNYNLSDGTTTIQVYNSLFAFGTLTDGQTYNITGVYQQYNNTKEVLPRSAADIEEVVSAEPSVTVTPNTINAPYAGAEGTLTLTYENITEFISFDYYFCDPNGGELEGDDPDWIYAEINEENDAYTLDYIIDANDGEARTAYMKVYTFDDELEEVYAIVTVNQDAYVVDYATLPFEWEGGVKEDLVALNGVTGYGLGTNYAESNAPYRVKFDTDGDYILIKTDQQPGVVTIGVKKLGGANASSITIEGSADGETFNTIQEFQNEGATNAELEHVTTTAFGSDDRYVRIYFNKPSGGSNVGVGPISIAVVSNEPSVTVNPTEANVGAEGITSGVLTVTCENIDDSYEIGVRFYADPQTPATDPAIYEEWFEIVPAGGSSNDFHYEVFANEGDARTAYLTICAFAGNGDIVAESQLVTINQAAAPQQYTLEVTSISNAEIFVFDATDPDDNDWVYLFEGVGSEQVTEGTPIALSVAAEAGYTLTSLMVNNDEHVNDIQGGLYTFTMPASNVTITVTAVENVAPAASNYVRIASLDQLTDGSKVIIAARHNATVDSYYAMKNATSGKPEGTSFTSITSGNDEVVASTITDDEDNYYWTVNFTENGYTFTNASDNKIGYNSGTNFQNNGNNTEWTIERSTAGDEAMVPGYEGFIIKNYTTDTRAFAFNGSAFGAYATSNMNAAGYNFYLDFFVQSEAPITETHTLTIEGYGNSAGGYYLIASPVTVNPADVEGMTTGSFDLYYFDEAESEEWRNWKVSAEEGGHYDLVPGVGYLYAHDTDVTLTLTGAPYQGNGEIELAYTEGGDFPGWNLVGNPYGEAASIDRQDFYVIQDTDEGSKLFQSSGAIQPMQGIFVIAEGEGETVTFTVDGGTAPGPNDQKIVVNVRNNRSNVIDRALIRFGEGRQLPKFMFNPNSTKLYIDQNGEDFAVVRSINENATPVSFHAAENGNYTLSINAENVEMEYLHLIDNLTGADVDLLATPNYSFAARTTDIANRFRLVYATYDDVNENSIEPFAFFNGSEWVISNEGNATLQVIDVMGRMISSETINGNADVNMNATPGVYMLRLVNGENVKVQKVVVR